MALPKTSVALFLVVVACAAAIEKPHVEVKSDVPKVNINEIKSDQISTNNTTTPIPTTSTTIPSTTVNPNTTTTTTTTSTTHSPFTTTTTIPPTPSPNSTTTSAPPTTHSPNVTTTAVPPTPTPAPTPGRHWDAPSFFGGMVLAFGIVAVGFVGYRFFYLGRGGAYHTL